MTQIQDQDDEGQVVQVDDQTDTPEETDDRDCADMDEDEDDELLKVMVQWDDAEWMVEEMGVLAAETTVLLLMDVMLQTVVVDEDELHYNDTPMLLYEVTEHDE